VTTTPVAPSFAALRDALVSHDFVGPLSAVAAFLASPVTAIPGLACGSDGRNLWMRGVNAPAGATISDHAAAAVSLAQRTGREGDRYIDLTQDATLWFKFVPTGAHTLAFGPDLLWGLPKVFAREGVTEEQTAEVIGVLRSQETLELPLMLAVGAVGVSGDTKRVELTSLASAPAPVEHALPVHARAQAAGEHMAELTGAELLSVTPGRGADDWVATLMLSGRHLRARVILRGAVYTFEQRDRSSAGGDLVADGDVLVHRTGIVFREAAGS
jgi:hypothetical protein